MAMKVCATCLTTCEPRVHTPGSFGVELLAWLLFCFPGLLYSLWRINGRKSVCTACGSADLIPPNSPRALQLLGGGR